jgi:hypothetical protein
MPSFRNEADIRERMRALDHKLNLISIGLQKQLDLPFFDRNPAVCTFLDVEKRTYQAALNELKWMLHE